MKKDTVEYWEKERGCIIPSLKPTDSMTEQEFLALPMTSRLGVDHESRIKFLKDNGYEVTRENMINSELSVVPKPAKKKK